MDLQNRQRILRILAKHIQRQILKFDGKQLKPLPNIRIENIWQIKLETA